MSDETKSPAERAMEAVKADAALRLLVWSRHRNRGADMFLGTLGPINARLYVRSAWDYTCVWHSGANAYARELDAAVAWLSARVSALFAACRAVDPEYARLQAKHDRRYATIKQLAADLATSKADAGFQASRAAMLQDSLNECIAERDAERAARTKAGHKVLEFNNRAQKAEADAAALLAQLAAAEERAARAWEDGRDAAAEWTRAEAARCDREANDLAARGKPTRAERRWDTWRRINRMAEALPHLTPPEAPDA